MKKWLMALCLVFTLSSCALTPDVEELMELDRQITSSEVEYVVASVPLTQRELSVLDAAKADYDRIRIKWVSYVSSNNMFTGMIANQEMVREDYNILVSHYTKVQNIVMAHYSEYTPEQQEYLANISAEFAEINDDFNTAWKAFRYADMAKALAKFAIKALSMIQVI